MIGSLRFPEVDTCVEVGAAAAVALFRVVSVFDPFGMPFWVDTVADDSVVHLHHQAYPSVFGQISM